MTGKPDIENNEPKITIDDKQYVIGDLSESAQLLVATYNEWQQDAKIAAKKAQQLKIANETLANQIVTQVRADNESNDEPPEPPEAA